MILLLSVFDKQPFQIKLQDKYNDLLITTSRKPCKRFSTQHYMRRIEQFKILPVLERCRKIKKIQRTGKILQRVVKIAASSASFKTTR
jgi:hypothetical protein